MTFSASSELLKKLGVYCTTDADGKLKGKRSEFKPTNVSSVVIDPRSWSLDPEKRRKYLIEYNNYKPTFGIFNPLGVQMKGEDTCRKSDLNEDSVGLDESCAASIAENHYMDEINQMKLILRSVEDENYKLKCTISDQENEINHLIFGIELLLDRISRL